MNEPGNPEHPHDAFDPREYILNTPFGEERVAQLKKLLPDSAKQDEYWVREAYKGYEASFAQQSNYEYMLKHYPWLHHKNGVLGFDADEIENPHVSWQDRDKPKTDPTFAQFLTTIPNDDWDQFIEDVSYLQHNYSIDEDREYALRAEAETAYWKDAFKDFKEECKKKFRQSSFQWWVISFLEENESYKLCADSGHYMEEEGNGSVYMRVESAVRDIAWHDIEDLMERENQHMERPTLEQMRADYDAAKLNWWNSKGGDLFEAACHRRSGTDPQFAAGMAALTPERFKDLYDRVVTDENIRDEKMPAYYTIDEDVQEMSLVVGLAIHMTQYKKFDPESTDEEAADEAANLVRDLIANHASGMVPLEHPELPFGGNLPKPPVEEAQDPRDFILAQPRHLANPPLKMECPKCGHWNAHSRFVGAVMNDLTDKSLDLSFACHKCGEWYKSNAVKQVTEGIPIPDPFDPRKRQLSSDDVRDFIINDGPDQGTLLWSTPKLYLIIPRDQATFEKYFEGQQLSTYGTTIIGIPDPDGVYEKDAEARNAFPFALREYYDNLESLHRNDIQDHFNNDFYGPELKAALTKRYREMAREARRDGDDTSFKEAVIFLHQTGGQDALKGFYRHIRPGQITKFDLRYGLDLVKRGRLTAAARRLGVDRHQISKKGYLYAVADWENTTDLFGEDRDHDYKKYAETVFAGETYQWTDYLQADTDEAIDWLLPEHYKKIRELLLWAEVNDPDEDETIVLQPSVLNGMADGDIKDMLKRAEEYGGRVEEIIEVLNRAHVRAQETAHSDGYHKNCVKALVSVLGPYEWGAVGKKDMLTFLIPWQDMLERLNKATEEDGDFDGSLDDLVEQWSEKAQPSDDPDIDYKELQQWYQQDDVDEELHELKPLAPQELPEPPGQGALPLGESLLMEGFKYGCTMVYPPDNMAQFILQWGQLNIPEEVLYHPPDDDTMGRETEIHATVKYGLQTTGIPQALRHLVAETAAFPVYIGRVSLFRQEDHDVVKLDVQSPWLTALHKKITAAISCPGDKHPSYKPHITLAYVQSGSCDHLVGSDLFTAEGSPGAEFVAYEVEYTGPGEKDNDERVREMLPLNKTNRSRPKELKELVPVSEAVDPREFILRVHRPTVYQELRPGDLFRMHDGRNAKKIDDQTWEVAGQQFPANPVYLCYPNDWDYGTVRSWARKKRSVGEALDPRDFINANAPRSYRIVMSSEAGVPWYFVHHDCWTVSKQAGAVMGGPEAEQVIADERESARTRPFLHTDNPRFNQQWTDLRLEPVTESVDPRDFILGSNPSFYLVADSAQGDKLYFRYGYGWRLSKEFAEVFTAEQAERLLKREKGNWTGVLGPFSNMRIEMVTEAFTVTPPQRFQVVCKLPGHDQPMFFQESGRWDRREGRPVPLEVADKMVAYLHDRYGAAPLEIVPVRS